MSGFGTGEIWVCGLGVSVADPLRAYPPTMSIYLAVSFALPEIVSAELLEESTTTPQLEAAFTSTEPLIDRAPEAEPLSA